ncbi:MAG: hypothetical protein NW224_01180 [Leptolyngbyaceae cyanobacterium bins.302]|nr:hypothetical protein [Leptolyngbyaceae cyanobacterium bins.302]
MSQLHLLAQYESLVQQHQAQFNPTLTQLQVSVNETLHHLQQQEQSLVDAQTQQLAQLEAQLATDARPLLNSVELQSFIAEVQPILTRVPWSQAQSLPQIDANSQNWQLAQTNLPLTIYDYEATVDHDAYDDENTHTAYGYSLTIEVGDQSRRIEVLTRRVYSPIRQSVYSLREQLEYYVEGEVAGLLRQPGIEDSVRDQLAWEISCLIACAVRLLALTPQMVQFQYPSPEEAIS